MAAEKKKILMTFDLKEQKRALLDQTFGEIAEVSILPDLTGSERQRKLEEADILFTWNMPREMREEEIRNLRRTRLVQLVSAGADHVPYSALPPGVIVAANVGAFAEPMAEHVLAMTMALSKRLLPLHNKLAKGEFDQRSVSKYLHGGVCGILGYGGIGRAVARRMKAIGMKIFAINSSGKTEEAVDFIGTLNDLNTVLQAADVVVIALPLNKHTHGLIGTAELRRMKPDAILINVARGAIVDEAALYRHLKDYPDFMAGIDAWWIEPFGQGEFRTDFPFLTLPNVLGTPHNSAIIPGIMSDAIREAAKNIKRYISGEPVRGIINPADYDG